MTKLIKLTDAEGKTFRNTQWGVNKTNRIDPDKRRAKLCTNGVFHAYRDLNLAMLIRPLHSSTKNPQIWEAEGDIEVENHFKCGVFELTTVRRVPYPDWYTDLEIRQEVMVRFADLCVEQATAKVTGANLTNTNTNLAIAEARAAASAAKAAITHYRTAASAADAAALAVEACKWVAADIDLVEIARRAVEEVTGL